MHKLQNTIMAFFTLKNLQIAINNYATHMIILDFFEIFNSKNNEGTVIGELFSTRYMLKLQYNSKLKKKSTIT